MTQLSRAGAAVLALGLLSSAAAWRLHWVELWVVAMCCVAALVLGRLACVAVPDLRVARHRGPSRVTAGQGLTVRLTVRNHTGHRTRGRVAVDRLGAEEVEILLPALPAQGDGAVKYEIPARRRGVVELGPLTLDRGDPLGLYTSRRQLVGPHQVIVHPRHHPVSAMPLGFRRDLDSTAAELIEGSVTFRGLRDYVPGDDLRRIHWRSTARTGHLVVRQDIDPTDPTAVVAVDLADVWDHDDFEEGLEVAASVLRHGGVAGYPVELVDQVGVRHRNGLDGFAALDALATFEVDPSWDLVRVLTDRGSVVQGSGVVVTGSMDRTHAALSVATGLGEEATVVVIDHRQQPTTQLIEGSRIISAPTAALAVEQWARP